MTPGCTVFVPVYNEEVLLEANTRRLETFMDSLGIPFEILVGSNGSTDGTLALLESLSRRSARVRFFHLPFRGVGAALKAGVRMAAYERLVTVDMDLSIDLQFIAEAYCLLEEVEVVIGSKITGRQRRGWLRRGGSRAFIALARQLLGMEFHDYSIAAKGYRKGLIERYLPHLDEHTFYVVEVVYRAWAEGRSIREIPVQCHDFRESRFNLLHEGVYKFGHLFGLWLHTLMARSSPQEVEEEPQAREP